MKKILNKLFEHQKLNADEAKQILIDIANGKYNEAQVAVFLGVYMMRSVGIEELKGFRSALLDLCLPVDLGGIESIDLCGTGGDGKNTFNISTTTSFVVAGAGYKVSKHGNYGVSSMCGSSNVLEHLGYNFTNDTDTLKRQIDENNICFMHAPLFHPSMKFVAPIRKALGIKTFFNMLGPLVNPAKPTHQSVGVFSLELARLYNYIFEDSSTNYSIVYALDGYDEVSLTDQTYVINLNGEHIINPNEFGYTKVKAENIYGGQSIEEAANILISILKNNSTVDQKEVVLANAALAINCFEKDKSLLECKAIAQESIESGNAFRVLEKSVDK
ncbi:MAG: anthranilate phosphoribosyltransferase [Saprospiraceae bacterium]|nr:anthranilate phosphoribosyltransferase [Bacteroidia bacterium]NNL93469.1 anthranilate phosphoribosyltransferase [Saprospiraceae bacterium]